MNFVLTKWPLLDHTIWTLVTIALAGAIGYLLNLVVIKRLQRLAEHTAADWDDAVIAELRRRIPLWCLLAGIWLSIGYWPHAPGSAGERPAAFISHLVVALLVLSVTTAVASIAVRLMVAFAPRANPEMQVSGLMRNVVRIVIFTIGLLVVMRGIGVEISPMLAALGVGGLAVALALQEPLSNLFAGLFITVAGQIRIGDYIKLEGGPEGSVADFKWNATQLNTLAGNIVIVPNAKLTQALVTNYHRPSSDTGLGIELAIDPSSDLAAVERIALEVARATIKETTGAKADAEPTVRFMAFSDIGIKVVVNVRSREYADQAIVRHELIKRLQKALTAAGIEISTLATPVPKKRERNREHEGPLRPGI